MSFGSNFINGYNLVKTSLRSYFRSDNNKIGILLVNGLLQFVIFSTVWGVLYYMHITNPPSNINDTSILDTFHIIQFFVFFIFFYYGIVQTITGLLHPFLMNDKIISLLYRLPINKKVLYHATQLMMTYKLLIFTTIYGFTFYPILIIGHFPWYHYILIIISIFLGFLQLYQISITIFFITKRIRSRISSIDFLYDTSNFLVGLLMLFPIILGFIVVTEGLYLGFNTYQSLFYVPILNSSVSFVGFVLRSGIPSTSLLALGSHILYIIILGSFNLLMTSNYTLHDEIAITHYKFNLNQSMAANSPFEQSQQFTLKNLIETTDFPWYTPIKSLIYKDWLAIRRTKIGDKIMSTAIVIVPFAWIVFSSISTTQVIFIGGYILSLFVIFLIQIIIVHEEQIIIDQGMIDKNSIRVSKFFSFAVIHLIVLSPLWIFNFIIVMVFSIVLSGIYAYFYSKSFLSSKFLIMALTPLYMILTTIVI